MKLAIRSQDLKAEDASEMLEKMTSYDIDGLQLVCYKTFPKIIKYQEGSISEEFLSKLNCQMKDKNKSVYLIGAYFNPVHSDLAKVDSSVAIFKEYLKLAKTIGCNIVGSETGSYNDDKWTYHIKNSSQEALERSASIFRQLCDYAKEQDAFVGIEGAAGHVASTPDRLNQMLERIGRDNIKVIFDLYNYLDNENHADYLNILKRGLEVFKGRILLFHIKDYILEDGKLKQVPVGHGIFDYHKILSLIKAYDKNAVLVLEGTTGEHVEQAVAIIKNQWQAIPMTS